MSHMLANGSILSDIEEQGNHVVVSLLIGSQKNSITADL